MIASNPDEVWTPSDFADLGGRAAVDKTLQRVAAASELRRIDRGLCEALHWVQDMLTQDSERQRVQTVLRLLLADPELGQAIRDELRIGLSALPIWMQEFLRGLLAPADAAEAQP